MNLNAIVAPLAGVVNTLEAIRIYPSSGSTTSADGSRAPNYGTPQTVIAGIQNLTQNDVYMSQGLDLQKETCAAYLPGSWHGVVSADKKGGDKVQRADGSWWMVTIIYENWGGDDGWTKVGLTRQLN